MLKPGIWFAFVFTLTANAQLPLPEEAARESFKKGVEAFHRKEFEKAEKELAAAEKGIADFKGPLEGGEYEELKRDLEWARARLEAARPS